MAASSFNQRLRQVTNKAEAELFQLVDQVKYVNLLFGHIINNPEYARIAARHDDILKIASMDGDTVAHYAAKYHAEAALEITSKPEILKMSDEHKTAVAHNAAVHEGAALRIAGMDEILTLKSDYYGTVAYVIAVNHPAIAFQKFRDRPEILALEGSDGKTVLDGIEKANRQSSNSDMGIQKGIDAIRLARK